MKKFNKNIAIFLSIMMFVVLAREDMWGKEKVEEYIEKINAIPNMEYQEGGEYFETFAKSSALIHDCGSFMAEYLYTKNPQCFTLESKKVIDREFSFDDFRWQKENKRK